MPRRHTPSYPLIIPPPSPLPSPPLRWTSISAPNLAMEDGAGEWQRWREGKLGYAVGGGGICRPWTSAVVRTVATMGLCLPIPVATVRKSGHDYRRGSQRGHQAFTGGIVASGTVHGYGRCVAHDYRIKCRGRDGWNGGVDFTRASRLLV